MNCLRSPVGFRADRVRIAHQERKRNAEGKSGKGLDYPGQESLPAEENLWQARGEKAKGNSTSLLKAHLLGAYGIGVIVGGGTERA